MSLPKESIKVVVAGLGEPAKGGDVIIRQAEDESLQNSDSPGDLVVRPGAGFRGAPGGSIIFQRGDGTEWFRVDSDGGAYVRGERVDTDLLIYRAIRGWFLGAERVDS